MLKTIKMAFIATLALVVVACDKVPPAHMGKFLTPSGYQPEVLPAGKYWVGPREELILIETGTNTYVENVTVKLSDRLTLKAEVRFRGRLKGDQTTLNVMFNDIDTKDKKVIKFTDVYSIYGQMVVRNKVREVIGLYNVDEVQENYIRLSPEIGQAISKALANTPIEISEIVLGEIDYPPVVNQSIEAIEERRLAITREQAQSEIEMTKKRNEQRLAEADYEVRMTRARTIRDENKTIGEGVTPQLLELKRLEVAESLAKSANSSSKVFLPVEALTTTGANVEMFRGK